MSNTTYRAADGSHLTDEDAAILGAEFEKLQIGDKGLNAREIVAAAKKPDSPMHGYFGDWNVQEAANNWWEHHARHLVNSIVLVTRDPSGQEHEQRAFVAITVLQGEEGERYNQERELRRYTPVVKVRSSKAMMQQVTTDCVNAFVSVASRFESYRTVKDFESRLGKVFDAVAASATVHESKPKVDKRMKHDHKPPRKPAGKAVARTTRGKKRRVKTV